MSHDDFYTEVKWCPRCKDRVHYIRSLDRSYCARCGGEVRVFRNRSERDGVKRRPARSVASERVAGGS